MATSRACRLSPLRGRRALRGSLAVMTSALAVAGCGGSERPAGPRLDVIWLQRDLSGRMARQTHALIDRMACPPSVARAGLAIECSAAFNAEPDLVEVTLLEARARPRYRARLKNLLLGALERAVQTRLRAAGFPATSVDCPGPVPQQRGRVSRCRVEDPQGRGAEITVRQIDDRGNVQVRPAARGRPRH